MHLWPAFTENLILMLPAWAGRLVSAFHQSSFYLLLLIVLLPVAMTMALLWKTKEVILDNVFTSNR
jgi:hypothetical protein